MEYDFTTDDDKNAALQQCFRDGWLHTNKLSDMGKPDEVGYFFALSLHRWYVEWKLWDIVPANPFQAVNLLTYVVMLFPGSLHGFSWPNEE
jgi:hypothetical protein